MKYLLSFFVFLIPLLTSAHTKWFAEGELAPYVTTEPTALYLTVWALIALFCVCAGVLLDRKGLLQLTFLEPRRHRSFERAAALVSMVTGAFFLTAGTHYYVFSPNLSVESGMPELIIILQILIGISLLIGFFERIGAIALVVLWIAVLIFGGYVEALEDIWVLSTAFFILVMGNDYFDMFPIRALKKQVWSLQSYALPVLRMGTGLTLFILGFSEKILHPEYGINFLSLFHWNFMQLAGFSSYSDYLFTLSAGAVESLFGLIFILGLVTRLNALVLGIFFTIPLFILGPIELAGHMPHFAAVVLMLFYGGGEHWKLVHAQSQERT